MMFENLNSCSFNSSLDDFIRLHTQVIIIIVTIDCATKRVRRLSGMADSIISLGSMCICQNMLRIEASKY